LEYVFGGMAANVSVDDFVRQSGFAFREDGWVPQSSWNLDKLDGSGHSAMKIDPHAQNMYQIEYAEPGTAVFSVQNPQTGEFVPVHPRRPRRCTSRRRARS